jgi:hypothetical protein
MKWDGVTNRVTGESGKLAIVAIEEAEGFTDNEGTGFLTQ